MLLTLYDDAIVNFLTTVSLNSKRYNLIETIAFDIHNKLSLKYNIINKLEIIVTKKNPLKDKQINNVSFKYKK